MTWVPPDGPPTAPTGPPTGDRPAPPAGPPRWEPTPAPSRRSRPWLPVAIGLAALLACVAVFVIASEVRQDAPGRPGADVSPEAAADAADAVQAEVAELSTFVAESRGLEFLEEVEVELLADDAFRDRLLEDLDEDSEELVATNGVLQAVRLLDPDDDLRDILPEFLGDAVVGFYDPETGELVVRGSELGPYVRSTLVHELTHALDDQHFELHRPELDELDDESSAGFTALVEGSAVRVEDAWVDQLPRDDRRALREEEQQLGAGIDTAAIPEIVPQLIGFSYAYGPTFVDALFEEGGQELLDEAFSDPPTSTAEIIDPTRHLTGRDPLEVANPPADGEVVDEGVYGQWPLLLTLATAVPDDVAAEAARGWAGDRYVAWDDDGQTCVRTTFRMVTGADSAALADALGDWAADHGDADVDTSDGVTLTACG